MTAGRRLAAAATLLLLLASGLTVWGQASTAARGELAERVTRLTRATRWERTAAIELRFRTYHPQGLVKVGDTFFLSSVEVTRPTRRFDAPRGGYDRDTGEGTGHLFKIGADGELLADLRIGEGSMYHPGGIDFDGTHIWVPVAEYRPDSRSIVYRVNPETMRASEVLRVDDHIGGVVHDTEARALHGVSWGSRRFYQWPLDRRGGIRSRPAPTPNRSHYVDYQDCKYVGGHRMLCTGVAEFRPPMAAPPFRLGGLELVDLRTGRPLHQAPIPLWTERGLDLTHNPTWFEPAAHGLRGYFAPEDDRTTIYVYETSFGNRN